MKDEQASCPACGREMQRRDRQEWEHTLGNDSESTLTMVPRFHCFACGKTFKEQEAKALVEVEG